MDTLTRKHPETQNQKPRSTSEPISPKPRNPCPLYPAARPKTLNAETSSGPSDQSGMMMRCCMLHTETDSECSAAAAASSWTCLFAPSVQSEEQEWLAPRCCPRQVHRRDSRESLHLRDTVPIHWHACSTDIRQALLVVGVVSVLQPPGTWGVGRLELALN